MRDLERQIRCAPPFAIALREERVHVGLLAGIGASLRVLLPKDRERGSAMLRELLVNRREVGLDVPFVGNAPFTAAQKAAQLALAHGKRGIAVDAA